MKNTVSRQAVLIAAAAMTCFAGDPFELSSNTISGGGALRSAGGSLSLSGTIGQPAAGAMSGGSFKLTGGFWFETPPGDCNGNGAVGLLDFDLLRTCWTGPETALDPACACFDFQDDQDIDLADFAELQINFAGE